MTKRKSIKEKLRLEHDKISEIEKQDECYTEPYHDTRTDYIEKFYVTEYNPITGDLRFYKVKKTIGKRASSLGKYRAYYYDENGKRTKSPLEAYLKDVMENKLPNTIAPIRRIDVETLEHMRVHIHQKLKEKHRKVLRDLAKEKENSGK